MNILVTGAFSNYELLKKHFNNLNFEFVKNEKIKLEIDCSKFDYVICNSLFQYNDIKEFKSLKYIQVTSAGLDRLPMDYINKHNIEVYNARGVYSIPMAEWVICKILDIYKKSFYFYNNQINKIWNKDRDIQELNNKSATIVGYGNVGQEIAKRLKVFGVRINIVDINEKKDELIDKYYSIENLKITLHDTDITILTLPLSDNTIKLFNEEILSSMKQGSILVNVSRGKIIDEKALIKEITKERFLGVILDVFENEPLDESNDLWNKKNVIITPHNSFVSTKNNERLFHLIVKNIEGVLK